MAEEFTVYKYPLITTDRVQVIALPKGAQVLDAAIQEMTYYIWALVNASAPPTEHRRFRIVGTGWLLGEVNLKGWQHLKTIHHEGFVWHIFMERA